MWVIELYSNLFDLSGASFTTTPTYAVIKCGERAHVYILFILLHPKSRRPMRSHIEVLWEYGIVYAANKGFNASVLYELTEELLLTADLRPVLL